MRSSGGLSGTCQIWDRGCKTTAPRSREGCGQAARVGMDSPQLRNLCILTAVLVVAIPLDANYDFEPQFGWGDGVPDDCIFDTTSLFPNSQPVPNDAATAIHLDLSGDEEEAADREEDPMDFLDEEEAEAVDYQTGPDGGGHGFVPTARDDAEGGPDIANQTAGSALDVEDPQPDIEAPNVPQAPSRGGVNQHSGEDLRSSGRDRPPRAGRDRPPTGERKKLLISAIKREVGSAKGGSRTQSYKVGLIAIMQLDLAVSVPVKCK
ncbi:hypothetical protein R1sor_014293 [Riccia sorocarpa]|uniref:Uncharacterized protein n=1 Tax=Riccia sorocarpa TaxID=122646 RepID=A0ABD3HCW0_9MARC